MHHGHKKIFLKNGKCIYILKTTMNFAQSLIDHYILYLWSWISVGSSSYACSCAVSLDLENVIKVVSKRITNNSKYGKV